MPAIVITDSPADELLSVEEAKRHLRRMDGEADDLIGELIPVAREFCERYTNRTLRTAVTRTVKFPSWWGTDYRLPFPPLLGVTSVTYYDASNVSQTLAASNYAVELSGDGGGRIIWGTSATIPSVYDREDAITVTYTAGYASAANCPRVAIQAMKLKLTELFGVGTESELEAACERAKDLLGPIDWTGYR
jgi:uncharacterized phiE125 gp8 family phage protein